MKRLYSTTIIGISFVLLMLSCSKQPADSNPNERIKALEAENARLKEAKPAVSQPTGELTRQQAMDQLNRRLAQPHISQLAFNPAVLNQAKSDGVIYEDRVEMIGGHGYYFTSKGVSMLGGLVTSKMFVAPFGAIRFSFQLTSPIPERVREISGIVLAPFPNVCEVEYITDYVVPENASAMFKYIYSGQQAKATFQKYDDGWRISGQ